MALGAAGAFWWDPEVDGYSDDYDDDDEDGDNANSAEVIDDSDDGDDDDDDAPDGNPNLPKLKHRRGKHVAGPPSTQHGSNDTATASKTANGDTMSQFFAPILPEFPFPGAESPTIDDSSPLDATNNSSTDASDSINAQVEHLLQYETEKESFPPIRETIDGRAMFLEAEEYSPSRAASAMPYIWQHHQKKKHHVSEFMMVVKVFSLECKVLDPREFTKIFGWTLQVRGHGIHLAYQKIQKALLERFPNCASRKLSSNFQAIIDEIYKVLDDEKLKQMVSGEVALVLKREMLEPLVPEAIVLFFVALVIAVEGVRDNRFVAVISIQKR
jgi:hypothetical protein